MRFSCTLFTPRSGDLFCMLCGESASQHARDDSPLAPMSAMQVTGLIRPRTLVPFVDDVAPSLGGVWCKDWDSRRISEGNAVEWKFQPWGVFS